MIETTLDISLGHLEGFDDIIDVRTPAEFAEDHLPGAINLPVLSNSERAEVGTRYVQESRFEARRVGAAYVARNISQHLSTALADKPKTYRPLIYCWRGGMRSNAMATILSQIGWRCALVEGGYKTWRRAVSTALRESEAPLPLVLLDGQTGTAKSDILRAAATIGVQVLDLEGVAKHRGSVFGGFAGDPQPDQRLFESELYVALEKLDVTKPILVEAESNRIGQRQIPKRIWFAMQSAPRITLTASPDARAGYLMNAYADIVGDRNVTLDAVSRLSPFHSKETIEEWRSLAETGSWRVLAAALMRAHYDPLYERSRLRGRCGPSVARFSIEEFGSATFERVAKDIASVLSSLTQKDLANDRS